MDGECIERDMITRPASAAAGSGPQAGTGPSGEDVFGPLPATGSLYLCDRGRRLLDAVGRDVASGAPLILLVGPAGIGKSVLLRQLGQRLARRHATAMADNPLDWEGVADPVAGRRRVCLIDDADSLGAAALERLYAQAQACPGVQVVLAGGTALVDAVAASPWRRGGEPPVHGLGPLSRAETFAYITHRFRCAGYPWAPLTVQAADVVHDYTCGVPGSIDALCGAALRKARDRGRRLLRDDLIRGVIDAWESAARHGPSPEPTPTPTPVTAAGGGAPPPPPVPAGTRSVPGANRSGPVSREDMPAAGAEMALAAATRRLMRVRNLLPVAVLLVLGGLGFRYWHDREAATVAPGSMEQTPSTTGAAPAAPPAPVPHAPAGVGAAVSAPPAPLSAAPVMHPDRTPAGPAASSSAPASAGDAASGGPTADVVPALTPPRADTAAPAGPIPPPASKALPAGSGASPGMPSSKAGPVPGAGGAVSAPAGATPSTPPVSAAPAAPPADAAAPAAAAVAASPGVKPAATGVTPVPASATPSPAGSTPPAAGAAPPSAPGPAVAALLAKASRQIDANHLTLPAGDNAADTYAHVLAVDPGNEAARAGRERVVTELGEHVQRWLRAGDVVRARAGARRGLAIRPDDPVLRRLLAQAEAPAASPTPAGLPDTASLLGQADAYLAAGQLTAPPGANAWAMFRKVLARDPGNSHARRGLEVIVRRCDLQARALLSKGDTAGALARIRQGLQVSPADPTLLQLQTQVLHPSGR